MKSFKSVIMVVLLCLGATTGIAQAKAGFGTGLVVGYLFGQSSTKQNHNIINKYGNEPTFEDRLYEEYRRNEYLIKKGAPNSKELVIRNDQIANEFARNARQKYIDAFSLKLVPVSSRVIENRVVENRQPFLQASLKLSGSSPQPMSFTNHRNEVRYEIDFAGSSPQPLSDFNIVSVNGEPAEKRDGKWFYTYQQEWGNNVIEVEVQDRKRPALQFTLARAYVIDTPEALRSDSNAVAHGENTDKTFGLMFQMAGFVFALLMLLFAVKELRKKPQSR